MTGGINFHWNAGCRSRHSRECPLGSRFPKKCALGPGMLGNIVNLHTPMKLGQYFNETEQIVLAYQRCHQGRQGWTGSGNMRLNTSGWVEENLTRRPWKARLRCTDSILGLLLEHPTSLGGSSASAGIGNNAIFISHFLLRVSWSYDLTYSRSMASGRM